ncbi:hypothetical protein [Actinomadura macra]|uniref:hypothetical protein n=1 Tax=Actinomadura macra TaxID=46164 RepID=UPI00082AF097|nr:hypothetical protein [Actinomadura macra]
MVGLTWAIAGKWGASFAVSCLVAFLCLEVRCRGQHRLFGRSSRWWAMAVILATAAAATACGNLVALASPTIWGIGGSVAAVGVLLAGEVRRSVQARQVTEAPPTQLMMIASVGIAVLVHRLEESFRPDRLAWVDQWFPEPKWLEGKHGPAEIQAAADDFFRQLIRQASDDTAAPQRAAELRQAHEEIQDRLTLASLCEQHPRPQRLLTELQNRNLHNIGSYQTSARRGETDRLQSSLCSDAMQALQAMLLCAHRWGYSLRALAPQTAPQPATSS